MRIIRCHYYLHTYLHTYIHRLSQDQQHYNHRFSQRKYHIQQNGTPNPTSERPVGYIRGRRETPEQSPHEYVAGTLRDSRTNVLTPVSRENQKRVPIIRRTSESQMRKSSMYRSERLEAFVQERKEKGNQGMHGCIVCIHTKAPAIDCEVLRTIAGKAPRRVAWYAPSRVPAAPGD